MNLEDFFAQIRTRLEKIVYFANLWIEAEALDSDPDGTNLSAYCVRLFSCPGAHRLANRWRKDAALSIGSQVMPDVNVGRPRVGIQKPNGNVDGNDSKILDGHEILYLSDNATAAFSHLGVENSHAPSSRATVEARNNHALSLAS
jgi:hypothetical protein